MITQDFDQIKIHQQVHYHWTIRFKFIFVKATVSEEPVMDVAEIIREQIKALDHAMLA